MGIFQSCTKPTQNAVKVSEKNQQKKKVQLESINRNSQKNISQQMATFSSTQYGLKATGTAAKVPDNAVSKLQYYLKSVLSLIQADGLEDVKNYNSSSISAENLKLVIQLAAVLDPEVFLGKCLFVAPELCNGFNNQFYEISQVTNVLGVAKGVMIAGSNKQVKKIMTCNKQWLLKYYYAPMKQIVQQIQEAERRQNAQRLALALFM